jgi:hypothetical protein
VPAEAARHGDGGRQAHRQNRLEFTSAYARAFECVMFPFLLNWIWAPLVQHESLWEELISYIPLTKTVPPPVPRFCGKANSELYQTRRHALATVLLFLSDFVAAGVLTEPLPSN